MYEENEGNFQARFSDKRTFLTPDTHTYVIVSKCKKCLFFEKFEVRYFLQTLVLRFALFPYYWRAAAMTEVMVLVVVAVEKEVEVLLVISYFNCKSSSSSRFSLHRCYIYWLITSYSAKVTIAEIKVVVLVVVVLEWWLC